MKETHNEFGEHGDGCEHDTGPGRRHSRLEIGGWGYWLWWMLYWLTGMKNGRSEDLKSEIRRIMFISLCKIIAHHISLLYICISLDNDFNLPKKEKVYLH